MKNLLLFIFGIMFSLNIISQEQSLPQNADYIVYQTMITKKNNLEQVSIKEKQIQLIYQNNLIENYIFVEENEVGLHYVQIFEEGIVKDRKEMDVTFEVISDTEIRLSINKYGNWINTYSLKQK